MDKWKSLNGPHEKFIKKQIMRNSAEYRIGSARIWFHVQHYGLFSGATDRSNLTVTVIVGPFRTDPWHHPVDHSGHSYRKNEKRTVFMSLRCFHGPLDVKSVNSPFKITNSLKCTFSIQIFLFFISRPINHGSANFPYFFFII